MRDDKKFVFIVTYGRSGSTLLMGILNSIPSFRILGENNNMFTMVKKLYIEACNNIAASAEMEREFNLHGSQISWWNPQSHADIKQVFRSFIGGLLDPLDEFDTVGFKEIRYQKMGRSFESFLIWLHMLTDCRFIFLTRNLDDTCKSMWHAENPNCKQELEVFERNMMFFIRANSYIPVFSITYGDIVDKDLHGLFDFLDVEYDDDAKDRIEKVLKKKHSY